MTPVHTPKQVSADDQTRVEIEGLIDAYWDIAYVEGEAGRTTDTPDGRAQEVRSAISSRLHALTRRSSAGVEGLSDKATALESSLALDGAGISRYLRDDIEETIRAMREAALPSHAGEDDWAVAWVTADILAAMKRGERAVPGCKYSADFCIPLYAGRPSPSVPPQGETSRDIFECANQLEGYVGPDTEPNLAAFLLREGKAAAALAYEIVRLRALASQTQGEGDVVEALYFAIERHVKSTIAGNVNAALITNRLRTVIRSALTPSPTLEPSDAEVEREPFQDRVAAAHVALFHDDPTDIAERRDRFGEEANELQQALGQTREEAHRLVDYTYDRPAGEVQKEIGAAALTLASLCVEGGWNMMACAEADLAALQTPEKIAKVRAKRATRHGRGSLPGLDPVASRQPTSGERE
jgi:hypothetical protein